MFCVHNCTLIDMGSEECVREGEGLHVRLYPVVVMGCGW
jgi:hypothetical protein